MYLVETAIWITIGHNLNRRVCSRSDVQVGGDSETADAEVVWASLLEGVSELNAVGALWVVSERHVHSTFDGSMLHTQLNRECASEWNRGSVCVRCVEATAWEVDNGCLIETTSGWIDSPEMGQSRDGQEREDQGC